MRYSRLHPQNAPASGRVLPSLSWTVGSDPAVTVAVSELTDVGYVIAPDAQTIELTARGFDAVQGGAHRNDSG